MMLIKYIIKFLVPGKYLRYNDNIITNIMQNQYNSKDVKTTQLLTGVLVK